MEYKELIQRPRIHRELEFETQTLMSQIKSILQQQRTALRAAKTASKLSTSPDVPETCREIFVACQIETKVYPLYQHGTYIHIQYFYFIILNFFFQVKNIQKATHLFFKDMDEANLLEEEARTILNEIQEQSNDIFDSWSQNILTGIRDKSLR